MGGEHNAENQSTARISESSKGKHGVYHVGKEDEPNQACSVCRSTPKRELTPSELKSLKRQNNFWK